MNTNAHNQWKQVVFVGLVIFLIGCSFALRSFLFVKNAIKTEGIVVDFAYEGGDQCFPVVKFITSNGKQIEFKNSNRELNIGVGVNQFCDSYERSLTGKNVSVFYNRNNPKDAVINNFSDLWLLSSILPIIGILTIITGWRLKFKNKQG